MKRSSLRNSLLFFSGALFVVIGIPAALAGRGQSTGMSTLKQEVLPVVSRSVLLNPTDPNQTLNINVSIPYANPAGMQAFVDSVSNPKSPNYRQFITPEEVGSRFGQPLTVVNSIVSYLQSQGFKIKLIAQNRLNITAQCTVAQAEKAFETTINNYRTLSGKEPGNQTFFAYSTQLKAPTAIAPFILDVAGMESFIKPKPRLQGAFQTLTPDMARVLYDSAPLYNTAFQGQGRTCAVSNFDGFSLKDAASFIKKYNLPTPPGGATSNITVITIDGGSMGNPPGGEGDLDIQMELSNAPLCNLRDYDGGFSGGNALLDVLTAEANDNKSDIISESYGWSLDSSTAQSAHQIHLSMSAQGITYCVASGDFGTASLIAGVFDYPDYDPEPIMVGGNVATTTSTGVRQSEVGWSGSGGGWDTISVPFNVHPSWQIGTGVPTGINFRLVPDVALHAAGNGGAYFFYTSGALFTGDGTSFASPLFDGAMGIVEQKLISLGALKADKNGKQRMGRLQDLVYAQNGRPDVWYDITQGDNGPLPNGQESIAHKGWDTVTGWGAIDFNRFIQALLIANEISTASAIAKLEGGNTFGDVTSTYKNDNLSFGVATTLKPGIGQVASAIVTFQPTPPKNPVFSVSISYVLAGRLGASGLIYYWNPTTNAWDYQGAIGLLSTFKSGTLNFTQSQYAKYLSAGGQLKILFRGIYPQHLQTTPLPFTLQINYLSMTRVEG